MKASKQNFIIDILAFIFFVFLTSTGIIIHYLLPSGSGHSRTIWGWGRHDWGDLHFYMAVGFLLILAFHLFKHWKWIWSLVKGRIKGGERPNSGKRALLGLVGLLAILILAVLPILSPVQYSGTGETEHSEAGEQMETTQTITRIHELAGSRKYDRCSCCLYIGKVEAATHNSFGPKT